MKALAKEMPSVAAPSLTDADVQRFWSKVDMRGPGECWLWTGAVHGPGYGGFCIRGRAYYAHRIALFIASGEWPAGSVTMHSCDVRRCVNAQHLSAGTVADNNRDKVAKGRANSPRGERNRHARLGVVDVLDLRGRYAHATHIEWSSVEAEAVRLGVTPAAVYCVITRRTWKHL